MKRISSLASKLVYLLTLLSILFGMGFIGLYLAVGPGLPEVESIRKIRLQTPMSVYSNDNQLIAEFGDKRRVPITLDQVPENFINALLATEDQRFYEHSGVDLLGVLRALINLARTGSKSQGASTITMLVARNYYLTREKRFSRKITEMFLAWKIESELNKDEILELFLNKIHFSHRAYGLGAAAQVYYGTTLNNLSLAKLATLAGIPKGESDYNPISNPKKARTRRAHVLGRMLTEKHITRQQYDEANAEPIKTTKFGARSTVNAPYLAEMVRREIIKRYGIDVAYNDGLKVYTTLKPKLQHYAQEAVREGLEEYDRRHGYRGPENNYPITEETDPGQISKWLHDVPNIGPLQPALVLAIDEELATATIKLKGDVDAALTLADVKWARKYVDENHRGKSIKKISQVLNVGDLIRVKARQEKRENGDFIAYQLAQVPEVTSGFVSLDPNTGAIEALMGGYDFGLNQFNRVNQARRQLGSNIKPFIYSAAFDKQYTPASIINDMPIVEADISAENFWRPKNDGDKYRGPTRLRIGLRHSKNTISVRLIREIGSRYAKSYLEKVGFPGENMEPYPSLALGSASFTPLEVVAGYAVLANGGYKVQPWFIERVETPGGRIIQQHEPVQVCRQCEQIIADQLQQQQAREQIATSQEKGKLNPVREPVGGTNEASSRLAQAVGGLQDTVAEGKEMSVAYTQDTIQNEQPQNSEIILIPAGGDDQNFANEPLLPIPRLHIAPRVIEERNRYLIDHILKDVIHRGTAMPTLTRTKSKLLKRNDLAGKTGTTNDAKDAWFSGYNASHVATAWVGFDDHSKKLGVREFGGRAALPIWQKFMEKVLDGVAPSNQSTPEGIVTVRIDPKTGLLATRLTDGPIFEVFRSENAPTTYAENVMEDIFNQDDEKIEDETLF